MATQFIVPTFSYCAPPKAHKLGTLGLRLIRIDFDSLDPDLDPGVPKCHKKKGKSAEMSYFL
jgi:hypothetical protein